MRYSSATKFHHLKHKNLQLHRKNMLTNADKWHKIIATGLPAPLTQVMCPMGRHFFVKGVESLKKPTTYEEQIKLIKEKGFVISNDDEKASIEFLQKVNYYRLSAYYLPFRKADGEFFSGIKFSRIKRIYEFDSRVRALVFGIIEDIEIYLRTQLAYNLSHKYGALGYLNVTTYSDKHRHDKFLEKVSGCIDDNKNTLVVRHHREKYDSKFPLWVIIEFFSIGMLSYLYNDLHTEDKKNISKEMYSATPTQLQSWLRCLTELRNRCAHYSRLYYWQFTSLPSMPKGSSYDVTRRLFTQLLVLKFLYPSKQKWNLHFCENLKSLVDEYCEDISLKHIDFPNDWYEILTN